MFDSINRFKQNRIDRMQTPVNGVPPVIDDFCARTHLVICLLSEIAIEMKSVSVFSSAQIL